MVADFIHLPYRPCVGLMVLDGRGLIFAGRRLDSSAGWQMPQGGVDPGETPEVAAMRELREETGLEPTDVTLLRAAPREVSYDLPPELISKLWRGAYRGQRQRWFALRLRSGETAINIATEHPEFSAWRWMAAKDLLDAAVPFKRDVYRRVFDMFGDIIGVASETGR